MATLKITTKAHKAYFNGELYEKDNNNPILIYYCI